MADTFSLRLISPERVVFEGEVSAVYCPGALGEFGVLAGHAPLLARLKTGEIRILKDNKWLYAAVSGGFSEVEYKSMRVLAEAAELSAEIDVARADAAKKRAEDKLKQEKLEKEDDAVLSAALERALNRLKVAGRGQ